MNATEQNIVRNILAKVREKKRVAAARRRQERNDAEIAQGEIKILMDDIRAEGIDPESAVGYAIMVAIGQARAVRSAQKDPFSDSEGFPRE